MAKGIIVYQSKYGAAKKYAEWLQCMTDFDCMETSKAAAESIAYSETVILCGGIYASRIAGLSFIKKNTDKLKNKKRLYFAWALPLMTKMPSRKLRRIT